jgi:hypothetical protein
VVGVGVVVVGVVVAAAAAVVVETKLAYLHISWKVLQLT